MKNVFITTLAILALTFTSCVTNRHIKKEAIAQLEYGKKMIASFPSSENFDDTYSGNTIFPILKEKNEQLDSLKNEMSGKKTTKELNDIIGEINTIISDILDIKIAFDNTMSEKLFADVFFDTNKSILKPESKVYLDTFINEINFRKEKLHKVFPSDKLLLILKSTGYADGIGSVEHNYKLSNERANAVSSYIKTKIANMPVYVLADTIKGKGEEIPKHLLKKYNNIANKDTADSERRIVILSGCVLPERLIIKSK